MRIHLRRLDMKKKKHGLTTISLRWMKNYVPHGIPESFIQN